MIRTARRFAFAGAIALLPSPAGPGSGQPFLTIAPLERGIAMSWLEPRPGGGHRLRLAERAVSGRWTTPSTIAEGDSFFVNWADFPSVAFATPGGGATAAAHWLWKVGAGTYAYQVRTALSDDQGRTWGRPIVPHRDTTATEHGFVSLAPEHDDFRAVWLDGRNTGGETPGPMTLRTATLSPNGRISDERLLDDRVCDCCATALARTTDGYVVAYRDRSDAEVRDISVVRQLPGGGWSAPATIPGDGWKIPGCPVNGPALAAHGTSVVLAWFTAARDSPQVKVAVSADGGATFGPALCLSVAPAIGRVDLAPFGGGGVIASWLEKKGDGEEVTLYHRVRTPAGTWLPRRAVRTISAARSSGVPQVVVHGGEVVFAWTEAGKPGRVRLASYRLDAADDR